MSALIVKSKLKLQKTDYQTISSLLLDNIKHNYDKTVLIDNSTGQKWSGDQVYEWALNLAYYLITECHLKPGDIVCFLCADSALHVVAMLAVWAAGGVYCSLPSRSTYREIDGALTGIEPAFLVTDAFNYGMSAVITTEMITIKKLLLIDRKSATEGLNDTLDVLEQVMQYERQYLRLPLEGSPENTCALLIASANDGGTKAVRRFHRNLIATAGALQNPELSALVANGDTDVVLITAGLYSPSGFNLCLHALNKGSTLVIATFEGTDMVRSLRDVWFMGTAISEKTHNTAIELFGSFRKMLLTAEAGWVTTEYLTEATPNYTTIGRPVAGVQLKVVDSNGRSVPHNTVGELCICSDQCSPGYLNNDAESQHISMTEGFVRSGEYGYYDGSGLFYIVGHSEEFVKVDDYMVSTEELVSVLLRHRAVREAAVICAEDRVGSEYPKAFVSMRKHIEGIGGEDQLTIEEILVQFVNLRVDPRKWLRNDGIDILKDSPHLHVRRMSSKRELETDL